MKYKESSEQKVFVRWFKLQYPHYAYNIYAIPNGGVRKPYIAQLKKELGELPGIPDLCIAVPSKDLAGLYIEMKYGKNKPTEIQLMVHERLRDVGYKVETCWSAEEAINVTKSYLT